ncbi:MAG: hypothetical protein JWN40_1645 [Phycisphaerales bacterium]|nr:hypothetical protein [Phycisphaerales bacterium]
MPLGTLDYLPRTEFDTGRFVARYLQVLAWLSIASMVTGPIFFHSLHIDVSPVFLFWAASALKRRSRTARRWVLALAGLTLGFLVLMLGWAIVAGTGGMTVSLGAGRIANPALWQVAAVTVPIASVVGVPFAILMSKRARRQFYEPDATPVDAAEVADRLSEVR